MGERGKDGMKIVSGKLEDFFFLLLQLLFLQVNKTGDEGKSPHYSVFYYFFLTFLNTKPTFPELHT